MAKKIWAMTVTFLAALLAMFLLSIIVHWLEAVARGIVVVPAWY